MTLFRCCATVKLKNLFATTEAERAERFHLLPLMVTVAIDIGDTFGPFMQRGETQAALDKYIRRRDPGIPAHKWMETTAAARAMLESQAFADTPVRTPCCPCSFFVFS